jgi:hypothetical protein
MERNLITNPIGKTNATILKMFFNSGNIGIGNKKGQIIAKRPIHIIQEPKVIPKVPKNLFKALPPFFHYTYILTALSYKWNYFLW